MSAILVTGGAGFIGSHTCVSLLKSGYKLIVFDSLINSNLDLLKKVIEIGKFDNFNFTDSLFFEKGDIRDEAKLNKIFTKSKEKNLPIKAVIHFAGLKSVSESFKNPLIYWENNLLSTINLLSAMHKNKCFNIVFSSSATVYGDSTNSNFDEKFSISPVNPYGFTKATIEKILENIFNSEPSKWRIANLRYFNPIGAHGSGLLGEDSSGIPNNIFPHILKVAAGKINHLNIYQEYINQIILEFIC